MQRDEKLEVIRKVFYGKTVVNLWFDILKTHLQPSFEILEIGSGSGIGKQNPLYPEVRKIVGLDLDERVLENPNLDEAYHMSAYEIEDKLQHYDFDVIYSHMVAEHIDDASKFISTQLNSLKEGGVLIHSTVSKYYWTSMINDLVPVGLKNWLIKNLGSGRREEDIFPTHYKLNSTSQIKKISNELGTKYQIIRQDEAPGYLRRSFILMLIYTAIHKPLQYLMPALRPTFIFIIYKS